MRRLLGLFSRKGTTPAKLSNCAVWLDAQDAASFTFNGPDVSQWNNKGNSGAAHAVQGTAALQPLYAASGISGKPAVQFYDDLTAKQMNIANSAALSWSSGYTYFSVIRRVTDLNTTEIVQAKWNPTGNQRGFENLVSAGDQAVHFTSPDGTATGLSTATSSGTLALNTSYILSGYFDGANIRSEVNNASGTSAAATAVFVGNEPFSIGAIVSGTAPFAGYVGEIIFYTRKLPANEYMDILRYLSAKWLIAL